MTKKGMYSLKNWTWFSCLVVIDLAAKVNPAHVLNKNVHSISLLPSDVHHQHLVSLQQTLENLFIQTNSLSYVYEQKETDKNSTRI